MSRANLRPEWEHLRELLPELVTEMEKKFPYASVTVTETSGVDISVDNREQKISQANPSRGAVITVFNGSFIVERATGDLRPENLTRQARELASEVRVEGTVTIAPGDPVKKDYLQPMNIDPAGVPLEEKLDLCRGTRARAAALDSRMVNAFTQYRERAERRLFVNRTRSLYQEVTRVLLSTFAIAHEHGNTRFHGETVSGTGGFEIANLGESRFEKIQEAIGGLLRAGKIDPGYYDLVASPEVAGVIAHESFGHGVELDMFLKDRAKAREYLGKPVGSPLVNMADDPSFARAFGSYFFDDEGQLASTTPIIKDGIFLGGLGDLISSTRLGVPRTANGRRESFERKAYARMSNTFFAPGSASVEDLIASVENGVYVDKIQFGMEDPKDWGIQVVATIGREIKNGRLTDKYFTPVGITGFVPDLLGSVSMVASDFELSPGFCGKGHKEMVIVSSGGPHLKMKARLG